jgi:hypothetical protein
MRLDEFDLDLPGIVTAPLTRTEAAPDWVAARDSGLLPPSLFSLYTRSRYLSFGAASSFLDDREHILFSYFGLVMRAIKEGLSEADAALQLFQSKQDKGYDPEKRQNGEPWDLEADAIAKRNFKLLLSSLLATLDSTAELVAIFLPNRIANLKVGRAQFSVIETWLSGPAPTIDLICTPQEKKTEDLYNKLKPLVFTGGKEKDWLRFARILRNKSTHVTDSIFHFAFKHPNGNRYTFLQREWPPLLERYLHKPGETPATGLRPMPELLKSILIHQDIVSYAHDLRNKVTSVAETAVELIDSMYAEFDQFPLNQVALDQLASNSEIADFEAFVPVSDGGC